MSKPLDILKGEIADRLTVYNLGADARAQLRSLLPAVRRVAAHAARENFERLVQHRLDIAYLVEPHLAELVEAEASHFAILFKANFDNEYADSLYKAFEVEQKAKIGSRARNGAGQRLIDSLFREIASSSRFSTRRSTNTCGIVTKALGFDLGNALALEQREGRRKLQARHDELGSVVMEIESAVLAIVERVAESAAGIGSRAESTRVDAQAAEGLAALTAVRADESRRRANAALTATQEIQGAIANLGRGAAETMTIIARAMQQAAETSKFVADLTGATSEIGSVVSLISHVAHQTNLLALNATIEASRAGTAGIGFAVVASEVKALARKTSEATNQIADQINRLQDSAARAETGVEVIASFIRDIEQSAKAFWTTMKGQQSIVGTISQDAETLMAASSSVATEAKGVTTAVNQTARTADEVKTLSSALAIQAAKLDETLTPLIDRLRAA